jgi:hypothetical protein
MSGVRLNPPVHWESWCSWLLAIWLCISPGPLTYGDDQIATYAAVLTGFVLICTEIVTISAFRLWEEWINVLLAPWILHFTSSSATINFYYCRSARSHFGIKDEIELRLKNFPKAATIYDQHPSAPVPSTSLCAICHSGMA